MASIISGNTLGIVDSSLYVLGPNGASGQASTGRAGERVYVNSATGNLVVQNRDEMLVGLGPDSAILRTYNSQGSVDGDNNDNWRIGVYRKVEATGTPNTAGSTVKRTDADGAEAVYAFDETSQKYVNHDGAGAYDTLSYDGATHVWTWTDGDGQVTETYDGDQGGRITQLRDADGNALTYIYNGAGLVTEVQDASGEHTYLDYTGNNLTQVRTVNASSETLVRTRYGYDASNRLVQIVTDLTPDDQSVVDGNTYVVSYTYDGTSNRISTMSQSDGTQVAFTYLLVGSDWKVHTITDGLGRVTTIDYVAAGDVQVTAGRDPSTQDLMATQTYTESLNLNSGPLQTTEVVPFALNESLTTSAGWGTTALLESGGATVAQPMIKYDGAGNATAVWIQNGDVLARRYVDGVWGTTVTLDNLSTAASDPNLYVDASGNAIVSWIQNNGRDSVYVARFVAGAWQAAELAETTANSVAFASAAINASGMAIVGWRNLSAGVSANIYTPGTGWGGEFAVSTQSAGASITIGSRVAIDSAGNAMVGWGLAGSSASVRVYKTVGGWQAVTTLVASGTSVDIPLVGFDSSGDGMAIWSQGNDVFAKRYVSGAWQSQVEVTSSNTGAIAGLNFSMDPSGNAIASWIGGTTALAARFASGTWNASESLGTGASAAIATSAGTNSSGQAAVAWSRTGSVGPLVSRFVAGVGWISDLAPGGGASDVASVAVDARGDIAVASTNGGNLYSSLYDGNAYYTVGSGDTWASIAQALYGTSVVASALQEALGNPALTVGKHLVGLPATATAFSIDAQRATTPYTRNLNTGALSGAGWTADATMSTSTAVQMVNLASGPVAVWANGPNVYSSSYANGVWSAAVARDSSGVTVTGPVNIYTDGTDAVAVWLQGDLYVARCVGGVWQAAESLATTNIFGNGYSAAISGGKAVVTWQETGNRSYARIYNPATGTWTARTLIDSGSGNAATASTKRAAVDANGNVLVAWSQVKTSPETTNVFVNVWSASTSTWGGATELDGTTAAIADPQLVPDASGKVNLIWMQGNDVLARTWNAGSWGSSVVLDTGSTAITKLRIADEGSALVTWEQGGSIYVTRFDGSNSTWATPTVAGSGGNSSASSNGSGTDAVAWVSGTNAVVSIRTGGGSWGTAFTLGAITAGTTPDVFVTASGNVVVNWVSGSIHTRTFEAAPYFALSAGATWASLATTLYGSAGVAAQLQSALGNPALTTGAHFSGLPGSIVETVTSGYVVQAGDTWASIANYLYGSTQVGDELRGYLGHPALTAGSLLSGLPATLIDRGTFPVSLGGSITVPAYYRVQAGDSWASIAAALYGTADAGPELQAALGSPALTTGAHLVNLPATLTNYYVAAAQAPDQPAYIVRVGDSWESIAVRVYGDAQAAGALQAAMSNIALVPGAHVTLPANLSFTRAAGPHVDVTDATGHVTSYAYDASGQLLSIEAPSVGGARIVTRQEYDAAGNVTRVTNALGQPVTYQYDARGNRTLEQDALGNTIERTFGSRNEVLTETTRAAAGTASTVRYAYDAENHLRFVVTGAGRGTEFRYDSYGRRSSAIDYAGDFVDLSALTSSQTLTEAQFAAMVPTANLSATNRKDYTYDFRGQVATVTTYATMDANGAGVADGTQSVTQYVYDQAGNLRQTIDPRGLGSPSNFTTTYLYDGLGRLYSTADAANNVTLTVYEDAQGKTVVHMANGLLTTYNYDAAGQLASVVQSAGTVLGTTSYYYDGAGRVRRSVDPTGVQVHTLYDDAGRVNATIDGTGSLTEYVLDAAGNVTITVRYATAVGATALQSLYNAQGAPSAITLDDIRPLGSPDDRRTWNAYDADGRLVKSIDAAGFLTQQFYDAAGRVTDVMRFANAVDTSGWQRPPAAVFINAAPSADDRLTRNFYDNDGKLTGTLDGEGFLVEYKYDGAGHLIETVGYANATSVGERATGTLELLRPLASSNDIHGYSYYDASGRLEGQIDGAGGVTAYEYDVSGNRIEVRRYASVANGNTSSLDTARPASSVSDEVTTRTYNGLNLVASETSADGLETTYLYDSMGNLVQSTRTASSSDARQTAFTYDAQGRLIEELSARGSVVHYTYDSAGRRSSTIDGNGHRTLYYYDADGRLTHTINSEGEIERREYDALGQLAKTTRYGTAIDATPLGSLTGGLEDSALALARGDVANVLQDSVTRALYNKQGQVQTSFDALNNRSDYTYNAFGELKQSSEAVDAANALVSQYQYDHRGLMNSKVRDVGLGGLGLATTVVYDPFGRAVSVTDGVSVRSTAYDKMGREVQSSIVGVAGTRMTTYDALGRVLRVQGDSSNPLGSDTTYTYDTANRTVTMLTAEGVATVTKRDKYGETVEITDGNSKTTTFAYDLDGNLVSVVRPDAATTIRTYDNANLVIDERVQDPANPQTGTTTRFVYDGANRVTQRIVDFGSGRLNLATTTTYDAKGQVVTVTDPTGVSTTYEWDLKGQLTKQTVALNVLDLVTQYSYNARGKVLTVTQPDNSVTAYRYDRLGRRVEERVDPSGLNLLTTYEYDAHDQVVAVTDPMSYRTRYVRDAADRLIFTVNALGEVQENAYDGENRVTKVTTYGVRVDPVQLSALPGVQEVRDLVNQAIAGAINDLPDSSVETRVYDRDGRMAYTVDGNGSVVRRIYDGNGNVTKRVAYVAQIDTSTALTRANLDAFVQPGTVANDPANQSERYFYDGANRKTLCVDGVGAVTTYAYDWKGNVAEMVAYATVVPSSGTMSEAALRAAVESGPSDANRHEWYFHDAADRLTTSVSALNGTSAAVTRYEYDANGRVTRSIAHSQAIGTLVAVTETTAQGAPSSATDRHVRYLYDAAGRMTRQLDSAGSLTTFTYDKAGRVVQQASYANAVAFDANTALGLIGLPASSAGDRRDTYFYDAAGRQTFSIDGLGAVVRQKFDAKGNVVERIRYANLHQGSLPATEQAMESDADFHADSARDLRERFSYDAEGRLRYQADPTGSVTQFRYDTRGNLIERRQHLTLVDQNSQLSEVVSLGGGYADHITRYAYDAANRLLLKVNVQQDPTLYYYDGVGNLIKKVEAVGWNLNSYGQKADSEGQRDAYAFYDPSPWQRVERQVFDAAGRVVYHVDGMNNVQRSDYDALGQTVHSVAFAGPLAAEAAVNLDTLDDAYSVIEADRETTNVFDAQGRLLASTDALEAQELYGYDAVGNKTSYTDKRGSQWTYDHDAQGNLTAEHAPAVLVSSLSSSFVLTTEMKSITTSMAYDAMGRLLTRTEFANVTASARTTSYLYDAAGRQVRTTLPPVQVFNPANGQTTTQSLTTEVGYDSLGRAVWNKDTAGNYSYKTYDSVGRLHFEIDAEGGVAGYEYDTFAQILRTTRFANRLTLSAGPMSPASLESVVASANDRVITTKRDPAGRVVQVFQGAGFVYDLNNGGSAIDRSTYTLTSYNPFGEVKWTGTAADYDPGGRWNATFFYYDACGNKILQIDGLGHPTRFEYDSAGNMVSKLEYADALTNFDVTWFPNDFFTYDLPDEVVNPDNRKTTYTYDELGRKTSETRFNVEYSSDGLTTTRGPVTTTYSYDAAGNLLATATPDGTTYTYYDNMGRVYAVQAVARDSGAGTLAPVTYFHLDASGNVVQRIDHAADVASVSLGGVASIALDPAHDRVQSTLYDTHGKAVGTKDAEGHVVTNQYDGAGHLVRESEGATVNGVSNASIVHTFLYDKVGRRTESAVLPASSGIAVRNQSVYNAFGEVVQTGVNGNLDVYYDYDTAGRMWRTNAGDGVVKVFFYDVSGGVTSEVTSASVDLKTGYASARAVSVDLGQMVHTDYVRDSLGRVVEQRLPTAQPVVQTNWIPAVGTDYAKVMQMENAWDAFFNGAANSTWTVSGGTFTLDNPATGHATFVATGGASVVVHKVDGPFVAIRQSKDVRDALGAQYFIAFVQGQGNFIPADYATYRNGIEASFNFFLDNTAPGQTFDWMGGKLVSNTGNTATYTDPNGLVFSLTKSLGPLALLNQSAQVRAGWQREFTTYFEGNGGETMEPVRVTSAIVSTATQSGSTWTGTNSVTLGWPPLASLGAGDVKVEITYRRKVIGAGGSVTVESSDYTRAFEFSDAEVVDHGTTLSWTDATATGSINVVAGTPPISAVRIYKKDVNGIYQSIIWQEPNASNVITYLLTVPNPTEAGTSVSLLTAQSGSGSYTAAQVLGAFNGRTLFAATLSNGKTDFQVQYTSPAPASVTWVHSFGTIDASVPTLDAIDVPISVVGTKLSWAPYTKALITSGENEILNIRRVTYVPTDWEAYRQIEVANNLYWTTAPVGDSRAWGSGTLVRTSATTAQYVLDGKGAFTFNSSQSVLEIAAINPDMRAAWSTQSGIGFVADPAALAPQAGQRTQFLNLLNGFNTFFTASQVVLSTGIVTKINATTAKFTANGGGWITFTKSGGVLNAAALSTELYQGLSNAYQVTLSTAAWQELAITNKSVELSQLGPGSYQYELLHLRGATPFAHATGIATITPEWSDATVGAPAIQTSYPTLLSTATYAKLQWGAGPVAGVTSASFRYRQVGTSTWSTIPAQWVTDHFEANVFGIATTYAQYEFEINNFKNGAVASRMSGTVGINPGKPEHQELIPRVSATVSSVSTPFPPASNYRYYDYEAGAYYYSPPVWVGVDENGNHQYGFGYQQGPIVGYQDGNPIYGEPTTYGFNTTAKIQFETPPGVIAKTHLQIRPVGTTTWTTDVFLLSVGGVGTASITSLAAGEYEYQLFVHEYDGETHTILNTVLAHASGTVTVTGTYPPIFTGTTTTVDQYRTDPALPMTMGFDHIDSQSSHSVTGIARTYSAPARDKYPGPTGLSIGSTVGAYAPVIVASTLLESPTETTRTITKRYDRWGNLLFESDPRSIAGAPWGTSYAYNANNQVILETKAAVTVTSESGQTTAASVMQVLYDKAGRVVATVDPNLNLNRFVYNNAGQLLKEIHADDAANDNGTQRYSYDAFGDRTSSTDGDGNTTSYAFDRMGRLTRETHAAAANVYSGSGSSVTASTASRIIDYSYDEAGRRTKVTSRSSLDVNVSLQDVNYQVDERGNITRSWTSGAAATIYTWDDHGYKASETDGNLHTQTWDYNSFGQLTSNVDLGGVTTEYLYSKAGNLTSQTSNRAGDAQNLQYTYDSAGQLTGIADQATGTVTTYTYDRAGNRVWEIVSKGGVEYQHNHNTYDAQGRLTDVVGITQHVSIAYDAAGNRRWVHADYYDDDAPSTVKHLNNWYTYDAMNRVLVESGVLVENGVQGVVQIDGTQGIQYTYDKAGNKLTARQFKEGTKLDGSGDNLSGLQDVTDHFEYDAENRETKSYQTIVGQTVVGSYNVTAERGYDALGRVKRERIYNLTKQGTNLPAPGGDDRFDTRYVDYDAAGRTALMTTIDAQDQTRSTVTFNNYDGAGNVTQYTVQYRSDFTDIYKYAYVLADGQKTSTIKLWHNTATTNSPSGQTTYTYDANMQVKKVADLQDVAKNRRYVTDANGVTYARADGVPDATGEITLTDSSINVSGADHPRVQHMLVVNGQTLGLNAKAIGSDVPSIARFDFGTHGGSAASDTPGHYVLTTTDAQRGLASLKSIAQAVYGDSSLWYVIADANGITENGQLTAGMSLTLPANVSSARNDANTFRPYDPAEIKGDNLPSLPHPQADQGCGAMGQIVVAIVVIIVAFVTQQYYLAEYGVEAGAGGAAAAGTTATGTTAYTAGSYVAADVVGAAAGNIAGQAVGNAVGVQDGFSWQSLAASVASAGITSGLSLPGGALSGLGKDIAGIAARAAINNAVNQGINVALGQQKSFSWAAVAASAVAAPLAVGIAGKVGDAAGELGGATAAKIAGSFAYGLTTQAAVKAATGGRIKWENIAADAFGNALGSSFAESLAGSGSQQERNANAGDFQASIKRNEAENWLMGPRADSAGFQTDIAQRRSENWLMSPGTLSDVSMGFGTDPVEAFVASGNALSGDGIIDLGDGRIQLADGRIRRSSVVIASSNDESPRGLYTNRADQQVQRAPFGGIPAEGPVLPSIYVAPNVPADLQSKYGPILAAYDRAGQGYWHVPTETGAVTVTPPPGYETPSQWELQGRQTAGGIRDSIVGLPGAVVETGLFIGDGYRLMGHAAFGDLDAFGPRSTATGNVTIDSAALGVVKSSPVGALFGKPQDMGAVIAGLPFAAIAALRGPISGSVRAIQSDAEILARVNKGKYPYTELNAAIAEAHGWHEALAKGHLPIAQPAKASAPGPDFITFDPAAKTVVAWDAKYRSPGGSYPSTVPAEQLGSWSREIADAIARMPQGSERTAAQRAFNAGRIDGAVFKWPK